MRNFWCFLLILQLLPLPSLARLYSDVSELPGTSFDFIVVGGGTAGNVIANRLTENPRFSVLVLEAGPSNEGVLPVIVPFLATTAAPGTPYDWNFSTIAQPGLKGRSLAYPRGHILGGSSSINYMVYSRGSSDDWDQYARDTGDEGWSWNGVQQYLRKNERWSSPADNHSTIGEYNPAVHSTTGVNSVTLPGYPQPIDSMLIQTASSQLPFNLDYNSGNPLGLGWMQSTVDSHGQRSSSATSYLGPKYINRTNLYVLVQAQVSRLIQTGLNPPTFKSVEFRQNSTSKLRVLSARKEIILSAGSIGSPHILMNSGIGDHQALSKLGVKPSVHLPDVGQHLADQPTIGVYWQVNSTNTIDALTRNATLGGEDLDEWLDTRSGRFVHSVLGNVLGWARLPLSDPVLKGRADPSSGPKSPHYEILPLNGIGAIALPATGNFMSFVVALLCPLSRGSVNLASSDPFAAPLIDPGFLTDAHAQDVAMMREGVKMLQQLVKAPTWRNYIIAQYQPPKNVTTDAEIEAYVKAGAASIFHPLGTAQMTAKGAAGGVVDPDLKVKGVVGLRVVDGSVFPRPPSANPQAAVYVVAERAADLIKEAWA